MSNKNKKRKNTVEAMKKAKKKRPLGEAGTKKLVLIFVAAFLGIAIILGAALGIAAAVKHSSYIFYYEGVGLDEGLLNYFASYYKTVYMKNNSIPGTNNNDEFWNTKKYPTVSETTYGSELRYYTEVWIKQLIATNVIFDQMYSLSSADKKEITIAMQNVFESLKVDSKSEFNEKVSEFGFDYGDFKTATEMIYKNRMWSIYAYGSDGSQIASDADFCKEFLSENYARVKLIFIRTESTFKKDEAGNRVVENGADATVPLTDEEKAERSAYIEKLKACVDGINAGSMDKAAFEAYASEIMSAYSEISANELDGYYLSEGSEFTEALAKDIPSVASGALYLSAGQAAYTELKADTDGFSGYCFMYRDEVSPTAYLDTAEDGFFSDFYLRAASKKCTELIEEYDNFEIKDKEAWESFDMNALPYMKYIQSYVAQFYS